MYGDAKKSLNLLGPLSPDIKQGASSSLRTFADSCCKIFGTPPLHERFVLRAKDITDRRIGLVRVSCDFSANDQAYLILWGALFTASRWESSIEFTNPRLVTACVMKQELHPILALALLLLGCDDDSIEDNIKARDSLDKRLAVPLSSLAGFQVGGVHSVRGLARRGFPRLADICMSSSPLAVYFAGVDQSQWPMLASLPIRGSGEPAWRVLPWVVPFLRNSVDKYVDIESDVAACSERFGPPPLALRSSPDFSRLMASFPRLHAEWCDVLPPWGEMDYPSITAAAKYLGGAYLNGRFPEALRRLKERYTRKISAQGQVRTTAIRLQDVRRPKLDVVLPCSSDTGDWIRWLYQDKGTGATALVLLIDLLGYRLVFPGMHKDLGKTSLALKVSLEQGIAVRRRASILLDWLEESERKASVE